MHNKAMQILYKFALEPLAEITADPNSYGFRPKRCVQDVIEQCFIDIEKAKSAKWVLEGDIRGCFDNISHDWILEHIPLDKKILKKWLSSGYIETSRLFPTKKGARKARRFLQSSATWYLTGWNAGCWKNSTRRKVRAKCIS